MMWSFRLRAVGRHSDQDLNRISKKIQSVGRVSGTLLGLEMTREWGGVIVRLRLRTRLRVRKGLYFRVPLRLPYRVLSRVLLKYYHPVQSLNGFTSPN